MDEHKAQWFEQWTPTYGKHDGLTGSGACLMEAVSYLAGEPFSDHPVCACPVLSAFGRAWNDGLPDSQRHTLKPFALKLLNTRSTPEVEAARSYLARDWFIRVFTPAWLELVGHHAHAEAIRALPVITDLPTQRGSQRVLSTLFVAESSAWLAGLSAARAAAWSIVSTAKLAAEWSTLFVAESTALLAERAATTSKDAEFSTRVEAQSAARSAASAAMEARLAVRSAARSAAELALESTIKRMRDSALELFNRMIEVS